MEVRFETALGQQSQLLDTGIYTIEDLRAKGLEELLVRVGALLGPDMTLKCHVPSGSDAFLYGFCHAFGVNLSNQASFWAQGLRLVPLPRGPTLDRCIQRGGAELSVRA